MKQLMPADGEYYWLTYTGDVTDAGLRYDIVRVMFWALDDDGDIVGVIRNGRGGFATMFAGDDGDTLSAGDGFYTASELVDRLSEPIRRGEACVTESAPWNIRKSLGLEEDSAYDVNEAVREVILNTVQDMPGLAKNRIVRIAVDCVLECGETRAKATLRRLIDEGLIVARKTGNLRTSPIAHYVPELEDEDDDYNVA